MLLMLYFLMFCIGSKASKKIQKYNGSEFLRDKLSLYWEITQHFAFMYEFNGDKLHKEVKSKRLSKRYVTIVCNRRNSLKTKVIILLRLSFFVQVQYNRTHLF